MKASFSLLTFLFALVLFSCSNEEQKKSRSTDTLPAKINAQVFGDTITTEGAVESTQVSKLMAGKDSLPLKVKGKIIEVCQKKGCWMNLDIGEGKEMRVKFRDYAFFVPKDAGGKTVVVEGYAFSETTSVDELKHYAEDEGMSKEEIAKITEPETNISFEANGVVIND